MRKTTRKGKKRDAEKELEAERLAALVPLPPVYLIDKLFAIDWVLNKDAFVAMTHGTEFFEDNTWKYFIVEMIEKSKKFNADAPEVQIDFDALLAEKNRLVEEARILAEAEAKAKAEAEEEARKLAEEEAIRKEKEEAKAAKAAKGKKPAPEVKKKPTAVVAKEENKNSTVNQESSLSHGLENMTLDENGNKNPVTDTGTDDNISDQHLPIQTDEELAVQLQQQEEKEFEYAEINKMKQEEILIKMILLDEEYKMTLDLIQYEQRCHILLEFLFLQYHFCQQIKLTYEQTRSYIATIYDCMIFSVFGVTKSLGTVFTTIEDPLSAAYFVALMMNHQINSAKYDLLLLDISKSTSSVISTKEDHDVSVVGEIEILLPEFIINVLFTQYSKTLLQHILAYKYAFKDCRYLKRIPNILPDHVVDENVKVTKTKKSKVKMRSKD